MRKILDEKELLEDIFSNGFSRHNFPTFHELLVLGKHFRQGGKGKVGIYNSLVKFINSTSDDYNFIMGEETLRKVARTAIKNPNYNRPNFPIVISTDGVTSTFP